MDSQRRFLCSYGFFTPATPTLLMMGVLLIGGFVNSLQFTSLNAIVYAEINADMSRAVSFASVAQQLSLSLGIAAGAAALQGFALSSRRERFRAREFPVGLCCDGGGLIQLGLRFLRLPRTPEPK